MEPCDTVVFHSLFSLASLSDAQLRVACLNGIYDAEWSRVQNQTSTIFETCITLAGFFHSRCSYFFFNVITAAKYEATYNALIVPKIPPGLSLHGKKFARVWLTRKIAWIFFFSFFLSDSFARFVIHERSKI